MQIPCVYIPGPAPAVSVANSSITFYSLFSTRYIYGFIWRNNIIITEKYKPSKLGKVTLASVKASDKALTLKLFNFWTCVKFWLFKRFFCGLVFTLLHLST